MGLFEKARHLADAQLRALLEPGAAVPDEELKRAILDLDGYRREISGQLAKHANEETFLGKRLAERSAAIALWRERHALAQHHKRAELAEAAATRADHEVAERDALEKRRELLQAAIANLTVSLDRVERTLRLLREKRRRLAAIRSGGVPTALSMAPADAEAGADSSLLPRPPADADDLDPIEAEFRRLEHEEVTRQIDRRGPGKAAPAPNEGAVADEGEGPRTSGR